MNLHPIERLKEIVTDPSVVVVKYYSDTITKLHLDPNRNFWAAPKMLAYQIGDAMEDLFPGQKDRWMYAIGRYTLPVGGIGHINDSTSLKEEFHKHLELFQSWFMGDVVFLLGSWGTQLFVPLFRQDTDYQLFMLWYKSRWSPDGGSIYMNTILDNMT